MVQMANVKLALQPPELEEFDSFEEFNECIIMWSDNTDIPKSKQGPILALSLPNESKKFGDKIRKGLFANPDTKPSKLTGNPNGVNLVLTYLKGKLGKDQRVSEIETFHALWRFERKVGQPIEEYVSDFETQYNKCKELEMTFSDNISAYLLLVAANLNEYEYKLIKAVIDIKNDTGMLYKKIKNKMLEMLTDSLGNIVNKGKNDTPNDVFFVDQHYDVLLSHGWKPPQRSNNRGNHRGNYKGNNYQGNYQNRYTNNDKNNQKEKHTQRPGNNYRGQSHRGNSSRQAGSNTRNVNPTDQEGNTMTCLACKSEMHLIRDCPHSYENKNKEKNKQRGETPRYKRVEKVYYVECKSDEEEHHIEQSEDEDQYDHEEHDDNTNLVMFAGSLTEEISRFTTECINPPAGTLDTCCSSSICGEQWLEFYFDAITPEMKTKVSGPHKSDKKFMFGNQSTLSSSAKYTLPVQIAGEDNLIEVDVIKSDIPLLISNKDMKNLGMVLDMKNDTGTLNGKPLKLKPITGGHYKVELINNADTIHEDVFVVDLMNADNQTQLKA